ncbi:MAG TPA: PP2C family serine/threonine-protein phosphatase [Pyrinomonadaceae bacterium]|nr:PP2C family serine/threonine-protein phosphatase [Pyrinomonadaceae bacterium]
MSDTTDEIKIDCSAISDRGLNERRPLNEDSYLVDGERRIFAVADGVGGAEAGEVASKTAVEVLDEAFRHQLSNADIDDLMELAIQRANASIHQMAREHARLANMATTVVTLHLDGNVATIGHVGDSRLYRLAPDGKLFRETEDHSIVEEEVRAGRMTPEQAANHPSKNVISRALGAEETVEVDLKTIEIEEGTSFLLCSDGITRHIPDNELRLMLLTQDELPFICEELKRKCYERGAEDNLTAVLVRFGGPSKEARELSLGERTLQMEYPAAEAAVEAAAATAPASAPVGNWDLTEDALIAPSRVVFPASTPDPPPQVIGSGAGPMNLKDAPGKSGIGRSIARLFFFLVFVGGVAAAFYYGTRYSGPLPFGLTRPSDNAAAAPAATPTPEDPVILFEKSRRLIDQSPVDWINTVLPKESARQNLINPLDSSEAKFLYLYGRAMLLTGSYEAAAKAFEQAIARADQAPGVENATIRKEAILGYAAATLKSNKDTQTAVKHLDELVAKPLATMTP